ncbi:MAG: serine hydrolase domain-containing protein [Myxococcota bacterium]|nr:serine hydrolase domain-containing protein [Myxococcota bacterium]
MPNKGFLADTPESVGIDSGKLEALFERAEKEVAEGLLPSAQIAIARNGKIAGMRTVGSVRYHGREALATNDTLYCIFSSTKAITSAAAWLLIQEGKLDVDEIVADIIPEFGTNGKEAIRVEQLFTHTAGFPMAPFPPVDFLDRDRRLEHFSRWRLNFEPGSRFVYHPSSSMYVIADIIEQRSGTRYSDFVRQRIAEPLGLEDLWCGLPDELHGRLADIEYVGEALTEAEYEEMGMPVPPATEVTEENLLRFNEAPVRRAGIPGGGGTMTAADLALFYQALVGGGNTPDGETLWLPQTLEMAREVRSGDLTDPVFGKAANRALGLIIAGDHERNYRGFGHTNSERAFGHGGAGGQVAWADPQTGISVGYCTNGHDRNGIRQARRGIGISSRAAACGLD